MTLFVTQSRLRAAFSGFLIVAMTTLAASAGDPVFYSGGKAHKLIKSDTEFVVTTDPLDAMATRARLAADPHCDVRSIPWAVQTMDHCMVAVPKADVAGRARMLATPGVKTVRPVYRFENSTSPMLSTGRLVLRVDPGLTAAERTELFDQYLVDWVSTIDADRGVYTVRPRSGLSEMDVATAAVLYRDDRTEFAHPDFIVEIEKRQFLNQFNDEFFGEQWHLNNTGQGGGTFGADINIEDAWRVTFGEDVLMGVYDDSVDVEHEDLFSNYIGIGHDAFLSIETSTAPNPRNIGDFHGTPVIGLSVADANETGVVGVAPSARFTASRGINDPVSLGQSASAFVFARQRMVDVHVNSWGLIFTPNSAADVLVDAIRAAFDQGRDGKGMFVVFASGNSGIELGPDDDLSTLPEVLGVGASSADDLLVSYSNFGNEIDILAPSMEEFLPGMVTTDNSDDAGFVNLGLNVGGTLGDGFGGPRPDLSKPNYTRHFNGTSASCPVAAGVAALIISANQNLTVGQVRTLIEQTADKVDPANAGYHPIAERSVSHGYGRINAGLAVRAAQESVVNGGFTWPERLRSVRISGGTLSWEIGDDIREIDTDNDPETDPLELGERTMQTLVVESLTPFSDANVFLPNDGQVFSVGDQVANGLTVVHNSAEAAFTLGTSSATRYYALFPSNSIGRYGFGVTIDSLGNVEGIGISPGDEIGGGVEPPASTTRPQVSINVTPLSGASPLNVSFRGNAITDNTIVSRVWDFGDGNSSERASTSHLYVVSGSQPQTFFATFTVTDEFGNSGSRSVGVNVAGDVTAGGGPVGQVGIVVSLPGSVGSNVSEGISPFSVELNVVGEPAGTIESIRWDLGDGATAGTIAVPHTYTNFSSNARTLPVSVEIMSRTGNGQLVAQRATRFITVQPDLNPPVDGGTNTDDGGAIVNDNTGDVNGDGTVDGNSVSIPDACGAGLPLAMLLMIAPFVWRRLA